MKSNPRTRASTLSRRCFAQRTGLGLAAGLMAGCTTPRKQLHVFIYRDYIDPEAVASFEGEHNCQVTFDYYEEPGSMVSKLVAGGASAYDIIVPGHFTLPRLIQLKLVAPLRRENLPNFKHIDPQFIDPAFDRGNKHSVPYLWGTTGIYARSKPNQSTDESWGLAFEPRMQPGPFLLLEDDRLCIGAALHFLGLRINSTEPAELIRARDILADAKKRSLGFATSFAAKGRVLTKDASMAIVYNTDGMQGQRQDPGTRFFVPKEGGGLWLDTLSIPAQAPHRDLAEAFINHLTDPRVAAGIADVTRTATANRSALDFVNPADRNDPGIYPTPDIMKRLEYCHDLGAKNRLFEEIWTQVKSG